MTKVILDFQKLRDSSNLDKSLQAMADAAKEAQGFLFCSRGKDGSENSIQLIRSLSPLELAIMIDSIVDSHPEIKMIRMMNAMSKQQRR